MPWVPASRTSSGYGSAPVYDSACRDSRPTCGPLPCAITMLCSAASGAIASAATLTFRRWTSVVIASDRRSSALPPSAITIRILGLLTRTDWSSVSRHGAWLGQAAALGDVDGDAEQQGAQYTQKLWPVLREYTMNKIENTSASTATIMSRAKRGVCISWWSIQRHLSWARAEKP